MFETKTKTYARLERLALESMRFYLDERVAIITVTQEMYHLTGSNEQETEGLAPDPPDRGRGSGHYHSGEAGRHM